MPLDNQTRHTNGWPQQKLPKFGFHTHTTALWLMEQSSTLSAKFDCPVARQNFSLGTTAHDCDTGLLKLYQVKDNTRYVAEKSPKIFRAHLSLGCSTAMQLCPKQESPLLDKCAGALQPMSVCQACKLEKVVRDHNICRNVQHSPPLSTLAVRWYNHGPVPCYTTQKLKDIFSHFGTVRSVSFRSVRSAHVVFESIESACTAISLSNLDSGTCPLHMRWLPEAAHNAHWKRKVAVPRRVIQTLEDVIRSPQAITRPSQICCTIHARPGSIPR